MYPLISLGNLIEIPTYFLVISLACSLSLIWFWRRTLKLHLNAHMGLDLALVILGSGFFGARLFHILWEEPQFYIENPALTINVFSGGYVFFGGVLGAVIASYFFCKWKNEPFLQWGDVIAPVISFGYAVGRLGCLVRGCCYGKACELPWAITLSDGVARHPTQLYAALIEFGILFYLLRKERYSHKTGEIFFRWVVLHSTARVFLEIFRDDPRGLAPLGISIATWLSLIFISLAIRYQNRSQT